MRISDWSSDVCSSDLGELGDEREAEPSTLALGRDEGVEQVAANIGGNARTIVADAELDRQRDAAAPVAIVDREPVARGGRDAPHPLVAPRERFAGVVD